MVSIDREISKKLELVLLQLFKRRDSEAFRDPVDYIGLGLTDYPQIITKMMDLGTVRRNLRSGVYSCTQDCLKDIQLVWDNCKRYNMEGSYIHNTAVKLEKISEGIIGEVLGEVAEGRENTSKRGGSFENNSDEFGN